MTILNATFAYDQVYVPKGKRTPTSARLRAETPVQIMDLNDADAPVAVIVRPQPRIERGRQKPMPKERLFRHDGQSFLRPLRGPDGQDMTPAVFEAAVTAMAGQDVDWADYPFAFEMKEYKKTVVEPGKWKIERTVGYRVRERVLSYPHVSEVAASQADLDQKETFAGRCQALGSSIVTVEGVIYVRCDEPTIEFHSARDDQPNPTVRYGKIGLDSEKPNRRQFRLDQHEAVDAYAKANRVYKDDYRPSPVVDVIRPETLSFDPFVNAGRCFVNDEMPHLATMIGHLRSTDALRAFCDLRDQIDAWDGEDVVRLRAICASARACCEHSLEMRSEGRRDNGYVGAIRPLGNPFEHLFEMERLMHGDAPEMDLDAAAIAHALR